MGGRSSQSQAQTFTDNRAVLGEGSLYANNGASVALTSVNTDGGIVSRGLDSVDRATEGAHDFGTQALSAVSSGVAQMLNFGSDSQAEAFSFGRSSLEAVDRTVDGAYAFGNDALGFGRTALTLGGDYLGRVLDQSTQTQELVADAYNDAKGRGAMTDKLLMLAVAASALVAWSAVKGK